MFRKHRGEHDRVLASGTAEARRRFGGLDLPAALAGMLAALGLAVLLGAAAVAAGSYGQDGDTVSEDLSAVGFVTGLAVLVAALFVGGWVTGRMARYDGVRNATLCAVLFVLLLAAATGVGVWLDSRNELNTDVQLPDWLANPDTGAAIGAGAAAVVVGLIASWLGGAVGTRYHRRADAVVATATTGIVHADADLELERSEQAERQSVE